MRKYCEEIGTCSTKDIIKLRNYLRNYFKVYSLKYEITNIITK